MKNRRILCLKDGLFIFGVFWSIIYDGELEKVCSILIMSRRPGIYLFNNSINSPAKWLSVERTMLGLEDQ